MENESHIKNEGHLEGPRDDQQGAASILSSPDIRVKSPSKYKVLLHNDDYTPMEFVVEVLERIFRKDSSMATKIMMDVHHKGIGVCGVYPYDIAETKVVLVLENARNHKYPLQCTLEEE